MSKQLDKKLSLFFSVIISCLLVSNIDFINQSAYAQTLLTQTEIQEKLKQLPDWKLEEKQLRRTYQFKNFLESINFVNSLVEPAEKAGHHPDIFISYNKVVIIITTHDLGGLTEKDFDLAKTISQLPPP